MFKSSVLLLYFIVIFFPFQQSKSQSPAKEVRAVWLTTNWNLDWPSPNKTSEQQKKQLIEILDELKKMNFNTIFFQARIRGDVFYKSAHEPMSPFAKKDYDALAFAVAECHKRGIECHAWFVTYPVGTKKQVAAHGKNSVVNKHRRLCKFHNGEWYLDPGNPGTKKYILQLVEEVIRKYDIDGIHFDYIRYPEEAKKFPDKDTYKKYGNGKNLQEWRRDNITQMVEEIYWLVKKEKPWMQVSSSPIGKYKNLDYNSGGWTAYESVHQDAGLWLQKGIHDAIYPMMYYKDQHFYPYLTDWVKNCNKRLVVPGIGVYRMLEKEGNWNAKDIIEQINYTREQQVEGQCFFRAGNILNNTKGIKTQLSKYYEYPAKLPAMNWLDSIAPNSPIELQVFKNDGGRLSLRWQPYDNREQQTYTVYYSTDENIDINNPANILTTGIRRNEAEFIIQLGEFGYYYSVTASDRFHNESVPCFPAFFSHSENEK